MSFNNCAPFQSPQLSSPYVQWGEESLFSTRSVGFTASPALRIPDIQQQRRVQLVDPFLRMVMTTLCRWKRFHSEQTARRTFSSPLANSSHQRICWAIKWQLRNQPLNRFNSVVQQLMRDDVFLVEGWRQYGGHKGYKLAKTDGFLSELKEGYVLIILYKWLRRFCILQLSTESN